jgi:hypothetical protein
MRRHIRQGGKKFRRDAGRLQTIQLSVVWHKRYFGGLQLVQDVGHRHSGDLPCHQSGCGERMLRRVPGVLVSLHGAPHEMQRAASPTDSVS